jgi:hypothetical protein
VILVDASVWVEHFRGELEPLVRLLNGGIVLGHPWVVGELALGLLQPRDELISSRHGLPQSVVAEDGECSRSSKASD